MARGDVAESDGECGGPEITICDVGVVLPDCYLSAGDFLLGFDIRWVEGGPSRGDSGSSNGSNLENMLDQMFSQ